MAVCVHYAQYVKKMKGERRLVPIRRKGEDVSGGKDIPPCCATPPAETFFCTLLFRTLRHWGGGYGALRFIFGYG
jgi:hypothetical protein